MNILTHNKTELANILANDLINHYSHVRARIKEGIKGTKNYISMLERIDDSTINLALSDLKDYIEAIDMEYRNSIERLSKYHIKSHHERTVMTIFGPLTFKKTFYIDKQTKESYSYIDDYFGFEKYARIDIHVKSLILEACCEMSMAAAGRKISDMIGYRTGSMVKDTNISKQTVRRFVRNFKLPHKSFERKNNTPDTLFLMLDEKFLSLQREEKKKAMVHHAVVFEDMELVEGHSKRKELINKYSFATRSLDGINTSIINYIYNVYDTDKIKQIYVMGDGANWIKTSVSELLMEGCETNFCLDRFHFKKALRLIFLDEEKEKKALKAILANDKKAFTLMCNNMLEERTDRKDSILQQTAYIKNNWTAARLSYTKNLSCCMEGQVSHNIASVLSSRPGGYSIKTLDCLLNMRMAYRNGVDIKKAYLDSYSYENKRVSKTNYDFSVFDMFYEKDTYQLGPPENINFLSRGYMQ